jgi:hypothetical protein
VGRRIRSEELINTSISKNKRKLGRLIPIRFFSSRKRRRNHQARRIIMPKSRSCLSWRINNLSRKKKNPLKSREIPTNNMPNRARRKNKTSKIPTSSLRSNKNLSRRYKKKKSTKK